MDERWEYRREAKATLVQEYGDVDRALNMLGCEGWELVGVENETVGATSKSGYYGAHTEGWTSTTVTFAFKRRKQYAASGVAAQVRVFVSHHHSPGKMSLPTAS